MTGLVSIKLPLSLGSLPTLWQADQRFLESSLKVYPGYYFMGDGGYIDEDGYVFIMVPRVRIDQCRRALSFHR